MLFQDCLALNFYFKPNYEFLIFLRIVINLIFEAIQVDIYKLITKESSMILAILVLEELPHCKECL